MNESKKREQIAALQTTDIVRYMEENGIKVDAGTVAYINCCIKIAACQAWQNGYNCRPSR